jgi:hypothetical protein
MISLFNANNISDFTPNIYLFSDFGNEMVALKGDGFQSFSSSLDNNFCLANVF